MDASRAQKVWTWVGLVCLVVTVAVMTRKPAPKGSEFYDPDARDAVAARPIPVESAGLAARPGPGRGTFFRMPSERRAEALAVLESSARSRRSARPPR